MPPSDFGGTNIRVELDPQTGASPGWTHPGYPVVWHLPDPAGGEDVIQWMGLGHGVRSLRLLVTDAEYAALLDKHQTGATESLNLAGAAQGTCLVEAIEGVEDHVDGWVTLTARFRKVQPHAPAGP